MTNPGPIGTVTQGQVEEAKRVGRFLREPGQAAALMLELVQRRERDEPEAIVAGDGWRAKLFREHHCTSCDFKAEIIQWVKWKYCPSCGRAVGLPRLAKS